MAFPGYTVVSELGKGGFATVYLAHADEDGETVAIKQFLTEHGAALDREKAANERACIERFDHANVLALRDIVEDENGVEALVVEFCEGGDLIKQMKRREEGGAEDERAAFELWRQILAGVAHMHGCGVAHLDLKPQNVLLQPNEEAPPTLKLCDFSHSFAASATEPLVPAAQVGAGKYMAPEVSSGLPYDGAAADVWSCAVILYTLLTGSLPFENAEKIRGGEWRRVAWFSAPLNALFSAVFVVDVAARPSLPAIFAAEWCGLAGGPPTHHLFLCLPPPSSLLPPPLHPSHTPVSPPAAAPPPSPRSHAPAGRPIAAARRSGQPPPSPSPSLLPSATLPAGTLCTTRSQPRQPCGGAASDVPSAAGESAASASLEPAAGAVEAALPSSPPPVEPQAIPRLPRRRQPSRTTGAARRPRSPPLPSTSHGPCRSRRRFRAKQWGRARRRLPPSRRHSRKTGAPVATPPPTSTRCRSMTPPRSRTLLPPSLALRRTAQTQSAPTWTRSRRCARTRRCRSGSTTAGRSAAAEQMAPTFTRRRRRSVRFACRRGRAQTNPSRTRHTV